MILSWQKTKDLLEKYQIPMVETLVIENIQQGIEFAGRVGFPVVLKLVSGDTLHKIDKGLVKLNIKNEQELGEALEELGGGQSPASSRGTVPLENPAEILIQKQVGGTELFMGIKRDKSFGPVVSFGLGGIFVEVLEDIAFGICPIEKKEAVEIIKSIKGYKILQGYRGQTPVDIEKLADILVNICAMAQENEEIREIDINPLFAKGNEILVADVKVIT